MPDIFSRINISEYFSLIISDCDFGSGFFLHQCQIIFPGKIFLKIFAHFFWVIFFWISAIFFSRINISEDFSLFLTILAVDFSGAALGCFPGLHTSESFFSGSVPDFFSRINISEDFSLLLTILAVDFFLDQCQIIFPGKIFLRILAYIWVIFFWISARFFFSDQYFWRFVSISDDFGSGFFWSSYRIFSWVTYFWVDFFGLVLDCFHTRNLSEDFGSGFFSRVV